ncbi:MAG: hypothetical protein HUJ95_06040 [Bacteroidales bacterium]|nr:hypothetical protein [Bacteroidales bacterium]
MMRKTISVLMSISLAFGLQAQNMTPSVVVTKDYSTSIEASSGKTAYELSDPEGVKEFNIDFDYSVFETKYLGSYDFAPYLISVNPETPKLKENSFYLRAGAGYTLHPELEFIWSPVLFIDKPDSVRTSKFLKRLRFNLYGAHNSHIGSYFDHRKYVTQGTTGVFSKREISDKGSDLATNVGLSLCYDGEKANLVFGVDYGNLGADHRLYEFRRQFNTFDVYLNLKSHSVEQKHFYYDVAANFAMSTDNAYCPQLGSGRNVMENSFNASADLGQVFDMANSLLVKVDFNGLAYRSTTQTMNQGVYRVGINPRYKLQVNGLDLTLGVKLNYAWAAGTGLYDIQSGFQIAPDLTARVVVKEKKCVLTIGVTGDNVLARYNQLVYKSHFIAPNRVCNAKIPYSVRLGLSGNIGRVFDYNIYGFFSAARSTPLYQVSYISSLGGYASQFSFTDFSRAGGHIDLSLYFKAVRFHTEWEAAYSWFRKGVPAETTIGTFLPAVCKSYSSLDFNVSRRIIIGLDLEFRTSMKASAEGEVNQLIIPHYENLGFKMEWKTARNLSLWLRGRNLLCQSIQYTPLYGEKGLSFTAGILWRF